MNKLFVRFTESFTNFGNKNCRPDESWGQNSPKLDLNLQVSTFNQKKNITLALLSWENK